MAAVAARADLSGADVNQAADRIGRLACASLNCAQPAAEGNGVVPTAGIALGIDVVRAALWMNRIDVFFGVADIGAVFATIAVHLDRHGVIAGYRRHHVAAA